MSQSIVPQSRLTVTDEGSSRWFSLRDMPAWGVSLGLHVLVFGLFACWSLPVLREQFRDLIASEVEEFEEPEYRFDVTVTDQIGNAGDTDTLSPSLAAATQLSQSPQQETARKLQEELVKVDVAPVATIEDVSTDALASVVDVRGNTENIGGVEGSIDRMTFEIMASLRERKTLVVWLFDESTSMKKRRDAVAERFANIYKQLGLLNVETKNNALKTGVMSFGEKVHFTSKDATDDYESLVPLVKSIPDDNTGTENTFTAVEMAVKKYQDYRSREHRNCMIVIVTDERGDDFSRLEECIQTTASRGFKVYCIGNAAPFGQEKGYVRWEYSDGFAEDLPVDQGPETVAPEHVVLPFWGMPAGDLNRMTAGLGPYALTRLCAETQGIYLITDEMRGVRFDPAVMRNYLPDYRPIRFYDKDMKANRAKSALVEAARKTMDERVPTPETIFRADTDTVLRVQVAEAQKPLAVLDYRIKELVDLLELGEKDRAKIKEPRWQASYDEAYGRALALRVRAYGYNMMLAQMKTAPKTFDKKGNNTWELVASEEITTGVQVRKMAQKAQEYLERVVNNHQGTPWAKLAGRELSKPLGWTWKETHRDYAAMDRAVAANQRRGPIFAEEEAKKKEEMRKKAAVRVKPKL